MFMLDALNLTVGPFRAGNPLAIDTGVEPLLSKRFEWSLVGVIQLAKSYSERERLGCKMRKSTQRQSGPSL